MVEEINFPEFPGVGYGSKKWKPAVPSVASLPPAGNEVGDVRVTVDTLVPWTWNGAAWQNLAAPSGALNYKGVWDAANPPAGGNPTLADGAGTQGDYYVVSGAGIQDLGSGPIDFNPADWVVYNGTIWQKADHTDAVTSVFSRLGAVVAAASDYDASQVDNDSGVPGATVKDALDSIVGRTAQELAIWMAGRVKPAQVYPVGTDVYPFELIPGTDIMLDWELSDSIDLSVNPVLSVLFCPTVVGTGDGTVDLRMTVRYVAPGTENLDKALDETIDESPVVTNTFARLHTVDFTLDKTKMAVGDCITLKLVNLGTGSYDGTIGIIRNQKLVYAGV